MGLLGAAYQGWLQAYRCCATTQLQCYTFNDGALYVAVPEILDHAFVKLGLHRPSSVPLRRIVANQTTRFSDGTIISIGNGRDVQVHRANGHARSAKLASEINNLMEKWQPILHLFTTELLLQPFSLLKFLSSG